MLYSSQSSRFRVSKGEGKALSLDRLRYKRQRSESPQTDLNSTIRAAFAKVWWGQKKRNERILGHASYARLDWALPSIGRLDRTVNEACISEPQHLYVEK